MMQAIVFDSVINDGYIHVPEEYLKKIEPSVKVIILTGERKISATTKTKNQQFLDFEKKWAGTFKLSDDDDNAKYEYLKEKYK